MRRLLAGGESPASAGKEGHAKAIAANRAREENVPGHKPQQMHPLTRRHNKGWK